MLGIQEKVKQIVDKENVKIINKKKMEVKISSSNLEDFLSNIKKIIVNEKISQS